MSESRPGIPARGLAVTLVSSGSAELSERMAHRASGLAEGAGPTGALDVEDADSAEFAVRLGEWLGRDAEQGATGHTIVALDPAADTLEVALVLEHVLAERRREMGREGAPVCIREVMAVSSVAEISALLFGAGGGASRGAAGLDEPGRLARRLEFAGTIVLADTQGLPGPGTGSPAETAIVLAFLAKLAPAATVVSPERLGPPRGTATRSPELVVPGRAHRLGASMGWQRELTEGAPASGLRDVVGTYVFRDPRPFHPERLHAAVARDLVPETVGRILRSRGFVRLASRPERVGSWATAGDVLDLDPTAMLSWDVSSPIGQEIVFFGLDLDRPRLEHTLSRCLLIPGELAAGPEAWHGYADPFPEWAAHHHH
jgi:hypothetical protein